jgi:hypothetical protein
MIAWMYSVEADKLPRYTIDQASPISGTPSHHFICVFDEQGNIRKLGEISLAHKSVLFLGLMPFFLLKIGIFISYVDRGYRLAPVNFRRS